MGRGPRRIVVDRLVRFDPEWRNAEFAAQVTIVSFLAYVAPWAAAGRFGLPPEIAWISVTVAQYAAWFVVGGSRARLWRTSILTLATSLAGVAMGVWLAGSLVMAAGATGILTALAFASRGWRTDAFVPALALPYALAFTAYYDPTPDDLTAYIAAAIGGGAIYLAVRFALWSERRTIDVGALVVAHRGTLLRLLKRPRVGRRLRRALRRMHLRALEVEERARAASPFLADALAASRVLATRAAVDGRDNPTAPASARAILSGRRNADDVDRWSLTPALRSAALTVEAWTGRVPAASSTPGDERSGPDPAAPRETVEVALACGVAIALGAWLSPERWAWAYITAVLVFYGIANGDDAVLKGWRRVGGTLAGGLSGILAARALSGHVWIEIAAIIALLFAAVWLQARSYAAMVGCYTALVSVFFAATGTDVAPVLVLRFEETVLGALAGALAARLVDRRRARADARETLGRLLDATIAMLKGREPDKRAAALFAGLERTLEPARMRAPLRLDRGDRRTIERRIATIARLVHAAELVVVLRDRTPGSNGQTSAPGNELTGPLMAAAVDDMGALRDALREGHAPAAGDGPPAPEAPPATDGSPNWAEREVAAYARGLRDDFERDWSRA